MPSHRSSQDERDSTKGPGACAHESCGCPAAPGHGRYCSGYCANAANEREETAAAEGGAACSCEHAACIAAQRVHEGGEEQPKTAIGPDPAG